MTTQTDRELISCGKRIVQYKSYELGGNNYKNIVAELKKKYFDAGCGIDAEIETCLNLQEQMDFYAEDSRQLAQEGNLYKAGISTNHLVEKRKEFNASNCSSLIAKRKEVFLNSEINKYQSLDSQRINAESKFQANKKFFIGASVLLIGVTLILVIKSK